LKTGEKRIISESVLICIFGVVGSLLSAWISQNVAAKTVEVEVQHLKEDKVSLEQKVDQIQNTVGSMGREVSEMRGIMLEWRRQESRRR
jgi:FtsZ-binding cell division protein ZapB